LDYFRKWAYLMSGILQGLIGSLKSAASAASDAYFNLVTLLLNTTATNGAQNNTFLDSSTNNFTITRNGNTTQGTFTPFSQTGWGNYFNGSSDYLTAAQNAAFNLGTGQFTVECWVYWNGTTLSNGGYGLINLGDGANAGVFTGWGLIMDFDFSGKPTFFRYDGSSYSYQSSTTLTANQWNHIAVSRNSSNTLSMWINGSRVFTGTVTTSFNNVNTNPLYIGRRVDGGVGGTHYFPGSISNVRVVTGTDVYGAANATITVPTSALTAVSGTALLTCQSNRFIDNSTNAFAITANGTPSVQAFSPFLPTAAYDAAVVGGSGYFDGTGDYLQVANNAALNLAGTSWTLECWYYPTGGAGSYRGLLAKRQALSGEWSFGVSNTDFIYFWTGTGYTGSIKPTQNAWNHMAATHDGTNLRLFLNGVLAYGPTAMSITNTTDALGIGGSPNGAGENITGYMCGARVVKGTAVYTAAFTPPTAPPTAITNTSLLANYTNAGIYDAAAKNVAETVGNAQVSTTQAKFGTTSIFLDGTGDWLNIRDSELLEFGSGNFTIETWVYPTLITGDERVLFGHGTNSSNWFSLYITSSATVEFAYVLAGSTIFDVTTTSTVSLNTWTHIAAVRNGTSFKVYINGTDGGSSSSPTTSSSAISNFSDDFRIGGARWNGGSDVFQGYIDDYRITIGYARYTANFTAPTAAFPIQ
jgi:hypothetical protein